MIDWTERTKYQEDRRKISTRPISHQSQAIPISIDSSPPRRVQPVQPTGTQGEESLAQGFGVPPPLFGRPGDSGELETQQPFCDPIPPQWCALLDSNQEYPRFRVLSFPHLAYPSVGLYVICGIGVFGIGRRYEIQGPLAQSPTSFGTLKPSKLI